MKLYYSKGACSLAVRIVINEIGLASDYEAVNLKTKQTESGADFLKVNSKGAVPTLVVENNEVLTENSIIQIYLAETANATQLLPAIGNFKRYRVLEWLNYVSTELHKGCTPLFNPNVPQEVKETVFIPLLKNKITHVDKHLQNNKFLTGDQFTLPDGYLYVILTWIKHFNLDVNHWANVSRFYQEVHNRKSVQLALKEESKEVTS